MNVIPPSVTSAMLIPDMIFVTSRSSGPGGQNVNKVNSKVTLKVDLANSQILSPEQKQFLLGKFSSRVTNAGVLVLSSQDQRSQAENKEEVLRKLDQLLHKAFTPVKKRKKTRPTKASKEARVKAKKKQSEKKQWRQKP